MQEHALRRTLSEELHARTFHDFDGAGRFIRFVFLVGNDDNKILAYINKFLTAANLPVMSSDDKFCLHDMASYALRIERHTEFLSISFVETGLRAKNGLAANAFNETGLSHMPFSWARNAPAPLFHAIWIEVGGKPLRGLSQARMLDILESRSVASNNFNDSAAQIHFAFDIDTAGFLACGDFQPRHPIHADGPHCAAGSGVGNIQIAGFTRTRNGKGVLWKAGSY